MPTVRLEYNPFSSNPEIEEAVHDLYTELPGIIAPVINIEGCSIHNGGVTESEIIVNIIEYSKRDLNVNDIQITIIAHRFEERVAKIDEMTDVIRDAVKSTLNTDMFYDDYINLKVGVSIWLVEMGYATF
jgi:hypothetical protein